MLNNGARALLLANLILVTSVQNPTPGWLAAGAVIASVLMLLVDTSVETAKQLGGGK